MVGRLRGRARRRLVGLGRRAVYGLRSRGYGADLRLRLVSRRFPFRQFHVDVRGGGPVILVGRDTGDVRHGVLLGRRVRRRGRRGERGFWGADLDSSSVNFKYITFNRIMSW